MKKKAFFASLAVLLTISAGVGVSLHMERDKTRNQGSLNSPIPEKRQDKPRCQTVNREKLDTLKAHGSAIINYVDFKSNIKGDVNKIYVINLTPGNLYYYQDRCLKWYGIGFTEKKLGKIMHDTFIRRLEKSFVRFFYGSPPFGDKSKLQTEEQIVHNLGAHYYMPLKNHRDWLGDLSYMDDVIAFFKNLPDDAELHFHCTHGRGRTTTFLALYDIFKNIKHVSLKDIINRHYCLGREDLFDTAVWDNGRWTQSALIARKTLVERFFSYMTSGDGYPHQTWTSWYQKQNFPTKSIQVHR